MLSKNFKGERNAVSLKKTLKVEKDAEKIKKPKQKKKKRLIIRNLSFKVNENELKEIFSKYGNVIDVKIPVNADGRKRGFGFIEYDNTKALIQAMKSMNYQEINGRKVAVDFAVDRTTYQLKVQNLKQESKNLSSIKKERNNEEDSPDIKSEIESVDESKSEEDEEEKRLNAFLKEFDSGAEALTNSKLQSDEDTDSSSSDESDEENEDKKDIPLNKKIKREFSQPEELPSKKPKRDSRDVSEGKTVFIRNLSFATTQEALRAAVEEYGECFYCLLCMDQFTDHPKGTAFVKFKEKSSADRLIEESDKEPGIVVDGRRLTCSCAISRNDVSRLGEEGKKPKDKRNLNLLRVGLIMPNSKESEGVSASDMTRRSQLEIMKKGKLKNVNFFVSDKRLMIHNLPRVYSDAELRKLFKNAAGKGAVITEARIMKEFSKTDTQGNPVSKGFGFVSFANHEDALKALNELNNNPNVFTPQKRPIVEFSVENRVALQSKERKKEKIQMRNKRRLEEKRERQAQQQEEKTPKDDDQTLIPSKKKNRRKKKITEKRLIDNSPQKEEKLLDKKNIVNEIVSPKNNEKKRKCSRKERRQAKKKSKEADMSDLINKYKDKLKSKIA